MQMMSCQHVDDVVDVDDPAAGKRREELESPSLMPVRTKELESPSLTTCICVLSLEHLGKLGTEHLLVLANAVRTTYMPLSHFFRDTCPTLQQCSPSNVRQISDKGIIQLHSDFLAVLPAMCRVTGEDRRRTPSQGSRAICLSARTCIKFIALFVEHGETCCMYATRRIKCF